MKDECGETFVYFTNDDVCKKLNCSRNKATRLFRELESYGLIYRRKQRLGKADIIYINTDFVLSKMENDNIKNDDSVVTKIVTTDSTKLRGIYIDNSSIEKSYIYPSINYDEIEEDMKDKRKVPIETVRKRFDKLTAEHIEYVISSLERNKSEIKNMRAYLLTTIYNCIDTLETECLYAN